MLFFGLPPLWGWLGLGLVLMALEALIAPGSYLIWIGLAAFLMAGLSTLMTFGWGSELVVFGILCLLCAWIGWRIYRSRDTHQDSEELNNPSLHLIGRVVTLSTPIENGIGQARVDDSFWRVSGTDLPMGSSVRVMALDGTTLVVEKVEG